MRVFAAMEIPEGTMSRISEWQKPMIERYPSLNWVSCDRMHLTLRFFGDIGRETVDRVIDTMRVWNPGPVGFTLSTVGCFGRKGSPSVYWLGGSFPPAVREAARRLGIIPDERGRLASGGFTPHITVARRRGGIIPMLEPPVEIEGVITRCAVIDSRLTSGGPEYTYLQEYDLKLSER